MKRIGWLSMVITLIAFSFGCAVLTTSTSSLPRLETPSNLRIDQHWLFFDAVEHAIGYELDVTDLTGASSKITIAGDIDFHTKHNRSIRLVNDG